MIHFVGAIGSDLHVENGGITLAQDGFDPRTNGSEIVSKTTVVDRKVNEIAQPYRRKFHMGSESPEASSPQASGVGLLEVGNWRLKDLSKLLQESHIALEKQLNIIHPVLQNRESVNAHAESEAGDFFRVVAIVLYEFEDIRINHAAAQDFNPA